MLLFASVSGVHYVDLIPVDTVCLKFPLLYAMNVLSTIKFIKCMECVSVPVDSQDDSLAAALLCLLSPGGEERHPSQEQQEQDAQDAADELEMSQAVWSQHDRHLSPQRQQTR